MKSAKFLAMLLALAMVFALCACGQSAAPAAPAAAPAAEAPAAAAAPAEEALTDVQKAIKDAETMTWDELLAKAKEEIGDQPLKIYTTTSRPEEPTFAEKTGIPVEVTQVTDSEIYELLENEVGSGLYGPDLVFAQDGYMLLNAAIEEGYVENYCPAEYADKITDHDKNPMVGSWYARLFFYNNGGDTSAPLLTNVWQLTEPEFQGVEFKSPVEEKTNMNFLITLTNEKWQGKLADAYKSYYGKDWAGDGTYSNISYEWIAKFIANCTFVSKDSTIAADIAGGQPGAAGVFVFSKFRSIENPEVMSIPSNEGIEGFGGTIYPICMMPVSNAKYPYAACLYINYILSEEGYMNVFGKDMGAYAANRDIKISEKAAGLGDNELEYWLDDKLVVEDPAYIQTVYAEAFTQIAQWCASK